MRFVLGSQGRRLSGVLALVGGCLMLWASVAAAEPPANDKFEDAEAVGPALPVLVPGSNVEATKESSGEPYDVFAAGQSVWYSWRASSEEVVTVDTCNSEFATRLTVFTGATLSSLTEVARDTNVDGRYCPDGAGATLQAAAGTIYSIMIDGSAFSFPGGSAPVVQGSFELKLERFRPAESDPSTPAESASQETSRPPADTTPPQTKLRKRVLKRRPAIFVFHLDSNESGSTFRCNLDKRRYAKCRSPKRFKHLKPGRHKLKVFAVDAAGNRDRSPAVAHFRVKRPKHRHKRRSPSSQRS